MPEQKPERFRIFVADDRLSATLCSDGTRPITASEVLAKLKELKIQPVDTASIDGAVVASAEGPVAVVVARGKSPVDEKLGRFIFKVPAADAMNGFVSRVEVGQLIGTTAKSVPGKDGQDVFGNPIAHGKSTLPFELSPNVTQKKDEVFAAEAGNLQLKKDRLYIVPLLEVDGDDEASGSMITFDGDVSVKGSLREGRGVNIKGSLTVSGTVKSSILKVGGSVYAKGGLIGKNKAKCVIGDELQCAFVTSTGIVAGGDVKVQTEIQGSRIFCSGQLHIVRGPIVGGEISANGGIVCQTLGNLMRIPTTVDAGIDRITKSVVAAANAESEATKKRIADVRSKIAPLMEKLKSLTPEQRERVTELMYEAEEMESKNQEMLAVLQKRLQSTQEKAKAEIQVAEIIYPGVKIRLQTVETVVTKNIQGPVKISLVQGENGPTIMVTETGSGTSYTLPINMDQAHTAGPAALKAA